MVFGTLLVVMNLAISWIGTTVWIALWNEVIQNP